MNRGFHVLVFIGLASLSMASAQLLGSFTATGNLNQLRQFHTATLLTNGKVLIAGGFAVAVGWPAWASTELYDPATGSFTPAGDMTVSRYFHTATLLPDGKVLIAGGLSSIVGGSFGGLLSSAELYDPSAGTFTPTGEMTTARASHAAVLLANGKVLIAGGVRNEPVATAELYDPSTGTFSATGKMLSTGSFTASLLTNGKVLLEGSYGGRPDDLPVDNEIYDPDTGAFVVAGEKANPLFPETASLLPNGKVLVTEIYSCDPSDVAELYDPGTDKSAATPPMTKSRGYSTATLLPEGKVFVAGRDFVHFGGSAELYDPATGAFSTDRSLLMDSEEGHTATLLPDGTVLMAGGWICCGYSVNTAVIYHPLVVVSSPKMFTLSDGRQGAILHAGTSRVVSPDDPAVAGEALEIYATGLTNGSLVPPQIAIGGRSAQVLFFGDAPGFVGLNQINVKVPAGIAAGASVPVRLFYLARPSNEVTIGVR